MRKFAKFAMVGVIGIIMLAGSGVVAQRKLSLPEKDGCRFNFPDKHKDLQFGYFPDILVFNIFAPVENINEENRKVEMKVVEKKKWVYDEKSQRVSGPSTIEGLEVTLIPSIKKRDTQFMGRFSKPGEKQNWARSHIKVKHPKKITVLNHWIASATSKTQMKKTTVEGTIVAHPKKFGPPLVQFNGNVKVPGNKKIKYDATLKLWKFSATVNGDATTVISVFVKHVDEARLKEK